VDVKNEQVVQVKYDDQQK